MKKELHAIFWPVAAVSVAIGLSLGIGIGWLIWRSGGGTTPKRETSETQPHKAPRETVKSQQSPYSGKATFQGSKKPTFEGSAQDAEAAWDQIEATTSTREENDAELRKLIDSLCNSNRWQEALDLILKKKGPGALRESLLLFLFYNIGNEGIYASLIAARNLPTEGDKKAATQGIQSSIHSYHGNDFNLAPQEAAELKETELMNIAEAFGNQMAVAKKRQMPEEDRRGKIDAILKVLNEATASKTGKDLDAIIGAKLEFLSRTCADARDGAIKELEQIAHSRLPSEAFGASALGLVNGLTQEFPEDTANKLSLADPLRRDVNLLGTSIARWVRDDRNAADKWLDANLPKFNQAQRDAVAAPMVVYCSQQGDEAIANEWLYQISDEKIKEWATQFIGRK